VQDATKVHEKFREISEKYLERLNGGQQKVDADKKDKLLHHCSFDIMDAKVRHEAHDMEMENRKELAPDDDLFEHMDCIELLSHLSDQQ